MWRWCGRLARRRVTIILTTHYIDGVEEMRTGSASSPRGADAGRDKRP